MDTTNPTTPTTRTIPGVSIFGSPSDETLARIEALIAAFLLDDFIVDQIAISSETSIGLSARHATATIGTTGVHKRAYYVEGSPYDLGYLTGRLAEPSVSRMTTTFLDNVVLSFLGVHLDPVLQKIIGSLLADVAFLGAKRSIPDVPQAYQDELNGILAGCRAANPMTKVTTDRLWTLNVGIDSALAFIYTLKLPSVLPMHVPLKPEHFRIPFMCTGYTLSGTDNEQKPFHYFGRDFMFTTADVFQDTACPIIYRPTGGQPMVSVSAPGWMGSITAMNAAGVAGSVNMAPSALCNPERPGLNSLLLNRDAVQNGATANDALQVMVQAQRGCSWIHILADGGTDDAYVVEAGMSQPGIDFMSYPPSQLATALQGVPQLLQEYPPPVQNGLVARAADSPFPSEYISNVNPGLFAAFKANPGSFHYDVQPTYTYTYTPTAFANGGFVNATCNTHNCPMGLYFAPPRQGVDNLLVATNRFI
ncbi:MAG TPA: hypothetical protein VFT45_26755, partial [Longimicrobium sp.]|nr:hypothetical protein [Longimicrobium sp.]